MATSDGYPTAVMVAFSCFYFLMFLLSFAGNLCVLLLCLKLKRRPFSMKWCIANLAVADLAFNTLTIFNFINFVLTWIGGQLSCKQQGFVIEACYTSSIMTLVLISFQRLKAVVEPFSARFTAPVVMLRKLVALWAGSFVIASPLLYAYQAQLDDSGIVFCTNAALGDLGRQIYYSIHAVIFFLFPLIYMINAQKNIFLSLRSAAFPRRHAFATANAKRHHKVVRTLTALTVAFAICWSPFMIIRTLMYFHLAEDGYIWRASQLLIHLNTALDPILYGIYGDDSKRYLQSLFKCINFQPSVQVTLGRTERTRPTRFIRGQTCELSVMELAETCSSTSYHYRPRPSD